MKKARWYSAVIGLAGGLTLGLSRLVHGAEDAPSPDPSTNRYPVPHAHAGLPISDEPLRAYGPHIDSPANQLHRLLFLAEVVPSEINGALPAELDRQKGNSKPWYFRSRTGTAEDRQLFGGDVRISPLRTWDGPRTEQLHQLARKLQAEELPALQRLLLQWDLLSVWWRLEQGAETPPEVLSDLARLIHKLALPAETIRSLPSGWSEARRRYASASRPQPSGNTPYFTADDIFDTRTGWREISRRSSQLFVSPQSLRSARVFLKMDTETDLSRWLEAQADTRTRDDHRPGHRVETAMILSLIGISADLKAVASPLIDEIRFRSVFGRDEEVALEETTTRDGSSLWVYFIDRQQTLADQAPSYRLVPNDSQSIFLEYGTAKHATYAAQCTLCHRLTNAGNQTISGIRSLSLMAQPRIETDPTYRHRLAEAQFQVVLDRLSERLEKGPQELPPAKFNYGNIIKLEP